jgi:hypothetical protein
MDVHAHIPCLSGESFPGMETHPYSQRYAFRPYVDIDGPLRCDRRRQGVSRTQEGDEAGVPLSVNLLTPSLVADYAKQSPVLCQHVRVVVAQLPEKARGFLDVGEEESNSP